MMPKVMNAARKTTRTTAGAAILQRSRIWRVVPKDQDIVVIDIMSMEITFDV